MTDGLKSILSRLKGVRRSDDLPADRVASAGRPRAFVVRYGSLEVGHLFLNGGEWEFTYTDAFKNQERVQALLDFPRKDKTYRMKALWPFFASRIPGLEQPQIRDRLEKEGIDDTDEAALLSRFGERSIANPFTLVESGAGQR